MWREALLRRGYGGHFYFRFGKKNGGPYWTLPELSLSKTPRKGYPRTLPRSGEG